MKTLFEAKSFDLNQKPNHSFSLELNIVESVITILLKYAQ